MRRNPAPVAAWCSSPKKLRIRPGCSKKAPLSEITLSLEATTNVERNAVNIGAPSRAGVPSATSMLWMPSESEALSRVSVSSSQPAPTQRNPRTLPSTLAACSTALRMLRSKRSVTFTCPTGGPRRTWPCPGETETTAGGSVLWGAGTSTAARSGARYMAMASSPCTSVSAPPPSRSASTTCAPFAQGVKKLTFLPTLELKFTATTTMRWGSHPRTKTSTSGSGGDTGGSTISSHLSEPNEPR
mmetsp:Transcript_13957/g.36943  ORF Transcript_13957/g.36943 Transcript_13957/m.36943 type:complete len:243 (-) Transcript_13957:298-1026(-)